MTDVERLALTDAQIKYMVDRFLSWKLPENFSPDAGISFKRTHSEQGPFGPQKYDPTGTNLFDATQADVMVRYMIEGMVLSASPAPGGEPAPELESWRDELSEIVGHLGAAITQSVASDDQIIMDHVKAAHEIAKIVRRKA